MVVNSVKIWAAALFGSISIDFVKYFEDFNATAAAGILQCILLITTIIIQLLVVKKNFKNVKNKQNEK